MKVFGFQFAPVRHRKEESHAIVEKMLEDTAPPPGSFVVLPEMFDSGWTFDVDAATEGDSPAWAARIATRFQIHLQIGFGRKVSRPPGAANATVIAHPDGRLGAVYEKMHPFGFTEEPRYYAAGTQLVLDRVGPFKIAPTICYDLRFPELYRHAVLAGADLITVIASWPAPRIAHWRALLIARAIENQAFVVAVNRVGTDPDHEYGGESLIVSPQGEILAEAGPNTAVISADIDPRTTASWRTAFPALRDHRTDLLKPIPEAQFAVDP
ncbi:MAG: carbon-nitrogen family hydrolase [Planctomycetota bacterium]|nr:carbon-nitrogen family hydrolase [Planctomycetota bacterium]MDA1025401.1 carbon-nitrogen family hydrolase [Planctomycetota bacterium]